MLETTAVAGKGTVMSVKKCVWLVQRIAPELSPTGAQLTASLQALEQPYEEIDVTPFTDTLPAMPPIDPPFLLFGMTTLITNAYRSKHWRRGLFFDPDQFTPSRYVERYGSLMLNADALVGTFEEIAELDLDPQTQMFVRPDDDYKHFAGEVMSYRDFLSWYAGFRENRQTIAVSANTYCLRFGKTDSCGMAVAVAKRPNYRLVAVPTTYSEFYAAGSRGFCALRCCAMVSSGCICNGCSLDSRGHENRRAELYQRRWILPVRHLSNSSRAFGVQRDY